MSDRQQANSATKCAASPRGRRALIWTLRALRNALAALGVFFLFLLYTGWQQYQDRVAAGDTACSLTRCM